MSDELPSPSQEQCWDTMVRSAVSQALEGAETLRVKGTLWAHAEIFRLKSILGESLSKGIISVDGVNLVEENERLTKELGNWKSGYEYENAQLVKARSEINDTFQERLAERLRIAERIRQLSGGQQASIRKEMEEFADAVERGDPLLGEQPESHWIEEGKTT